MVATLALLSAALLPSVSLASPFGISPVDNLFKRTGTGCSTTGTASCHNTTKITNTCCNETPGGLLLQTQFWDTNPSTGPSNSWTIHGLWPDNCDGTFTSNCDPSRNIAETDVAPLLTNAGFASTLSYMQTYWRNDNGDDPELWAHEWNTHGTCYSTLQTACLPAGSANNAEIVDFYNIVVNLFKTLPTYTWLGNSGILPSSSATFRLAQLQNALKAQFGFTPALGCTGSALNSISYYYNLKGSLIDGVFVPINSPTASTCPSSGITYPLKSGGAAPTTTTTSGGTGPTGNPGSLPAKSTLSAWISSTKTGGILTAGTWSTQTPATFTLSGTGSSFTMSTSKGACSVSGGSLVCGSNVGTPSTFSTSVSGSQVLLVSGGSTAFSSTGVPSGSVQETIFTGSGQSQDFVIVLDAATAS